MKTVNLWDNKQNIFTVPAESEEQQRLRFQVELEFVQCLANPNYLHCKCTN